MKVCFVILAHHQPRIFKRLIRNISGNNSDVVIHMDRRSNIADFLIPDLPNLHFVGKRRRVQRCGWSQTRAMCEALEHGLSVSNADYFMYLAGTDFPIQSVKALTDFLNARYPMNFLNWMPVVRGTGMRYNLIDRYYFNDLTSSFVHFRKPEHVRAHNERPLSGTRRLLGRLVIEAERMFNAHFTKASVTWMNFYHGSTRWCLNKDTVRFIVNYYRSREGRKLRHFLRFCGNSDEIFFQTVVLNSSQKGQCLLFDECAAREIFQGTRAPMAVSSGVSLHYVDWSHEREDPAILVESDFPLLQKSGKFFAYKFMDGKSLGLVELIEGNIRKAGGQLGC